MVLSARVKKENGKVLNLSVPKKVPKRRKFNFKLGGPLVVLLVLLGLIFYSFGGQMMEMYNVRHEIAKLREQMNEIKVKNDDLRKQIEQLNSEAYIEREAREKLGLVKPGEKIILEARPGVTNSNVPGKPEKRNDVEIH